MQKRVAYGHQTFNFDCYRLLVLRLYVGSNFDFYCLLVLQSYVGSNFDCYCLLVLRSYVGSNFECHCLLHCNPSRPSQCQTRHPHSRERKWDAAEDKMRRSKGECAHFRFNKRSTQTHDGTSAKHSTNPHETDNSAVLWSYVGSNFDCLMLGTTNFAASWFSKNGIRAHPCRAVWPVAWSLRGSAGNCRGCGRCSSAGWSSPACTTTLAEALRGRPSHCKPSSPKGSPLFV